MSESLSKKYYVYVCYIVDTNKIFYIGKGSGNRYLVFRRENKRFMRIVENNECKSKIVIDNLTEDEALYHEKVLIDYARENGYPLVNMQRGGLQPICAGAENSDAHKIKHEERSNAIKELWKDKEYIDAHSGANNCRAQGVKQYDLNGVFIKEYETLTSASKETGVTVTKICAVCKRRRKTSGGYIWRYSNDKHQTSSRKNYVYDPKRYEHVAKPILQYDKNGVLLNEYHSVGDAIRKNPNMLKYAIQQNLYGKSKSSYGFVWKFK